MDLTQPKTLADIAADGFFSSTAYDVCWTQLEELVGGFSGMESNFQAEGSVEMRLYGQRNTVDITGRRVAILKDGHWHWMPSRSAEFRANGPELLQLQGFPPATEMLLGAARTLEGGKPIVLADQEDGLKAAVALDLNTATLAKSTVTVPLPQTLAPEEVLIKGINDPFIDKLDEVRAVIAFAHTRDLNIEEVDHGLRISGAPSGAITVDFLDEKISSVSTSDSSGTNGPDDVDWRLEDISADAYFAAAEHAMFFSAHFPQAAGKNVLINLESAHVLLDEKSRLEADALVVATVRDGTFTWAWADEQLKRLPGQGPVKAVRQFGIDKLIPALVRHSMPAATARELGLVQAAMPILNKWNLVTAKLNDDTTGIVLIDAPELHLPPLSPEVEQAVLDTSLPAHLDRDRALKAYRNMRKTTRETQLNVQRDAQPEHVN